MSTLRIKIKIGDNEFDAEGPVGVVQAQLKAFRDVVSTIPRTVPPQPPKNEQHGVNNKDDIGRIPHIPIEKILHLSGRIVSLTALPKSAADAALLIMLGHKDLRNNVAVTGQEIGDGLDQSGRPVPRVDRVMDKALEEALVLKTGIKRGTRYRLTNQGLSKALNIAKELIGSLP